MWDVAWGVQLLKFQLFAAGVWEGEGGVIMEVVVTVMTTTR